jgi:hypothetical protein
VLLDDPDHDEIQRRRRWLHELVEVTEHPVTLEKVLPLRRVSVLRMTDAIVEPLKAGLGISVLAT